MQRKPVVGVMGSGSAADPVLVEPIARLLARRGVSLLTGGGGGTMAAVCKAFAEAGAAERGQIIAVLPGVPAEANSGGEGGWAGREGGGGGAFVAGPTEAPPGYPNEWSELVIQTHLPTSGASGTDITSRNHINILSSDVVLALPGGPGTLSEVELAVIYQTPCLACLGQAEGGATIDSRSSEAELGVPLARSVEEVDAFLQRHLGGRLLDQSL